MIFKLQNLCIKLETLETPAVKNGPVALTLLGTIANAPRNMDPMLMRHPMPAEWAAAASSLSSLAEVPDDIVGLLWPELTEVGLGGRFPDL